MKLFPTLPRSLALLLCAAALLTQSACDRRTEVPPPDSRSAQPEMPPSAPQPPQLPASPASAIP